MILLIMAGWVDVQLEIISTAPTTPIDVYPMPYNCKIDIFSKCLQH